MDSSPASAVALLTEYRELVEKRLNDDGSILLARLCMCGVCKQHVDEHEAAIGKLAEIDTVLAQLADPAVAPPQEPLAWLLIETWHDKSEHIEGIALTHEAKDQFMRGYYEPGQSRSASPYKILRVDRAVPGETQK